MWQAFLLFSLLLSATAVVFAPQLPGREPLDTSRCLVDGDRQPVPRLDPILARLGLGWKHPGRSDGSGGKSLRESLCNAGKVAGW